MENSILKKATFFRFLRCVFPVRQLLIRLSDLFTEHAELIKCFCFFCTEQRVQKLQSQLQIVQVSLILQKCWHASLLKTGKKIINEWE